MEITSNKHDSGHADACYLRWAQRVVTVRVLL